MKKKYLFIVFSSTGYLFPAIKMAHILQEDEHEVLFVTTVEYQLFLNCYGISYIPVHNDHVPFLSIEEWFSTEKNRIQMNVFEAIIERYKPDIIITTPLSLSVLIIAEQYDIPTIVLGFCEYLYPEVDDLTSKKQWRLESILKYYNQVRTVFGISPKVDSHPIELPLIGDRYLLRSTPEFNDHMKLPGQVKYVGGLYWEPEYVNPKLKTFIAKNKAHKRPLIYIQIGRFFEEMQDWNYLLEALKALRVACIVDIGRADYLPKDFVIPNHFYVHSLIPLGFIHSDIECVICSAQTTSVLASILYKKPMICIPHSADSYELAERIERKEIGVRLHSHHTLNKELLEEFFKVIHQDNCYQALVKHQNQFLEYAGRDHLLESLTL